MKFWSDILGEKTGKSSKRLIMLVFALMLVLFGGALFIVEIKENNVKLLNAIIDAFTTVIVGVAVVSGAEKFRNVDKKENNQEK